MVAAVNNAVEGLLRSAEHSGNGDVVRQHQFPPFVRLAVLYVIHHRVPVIGGSDVQLIEGNGPAVHHAPFRLPVVENVQLADQGGLVVGGISTLLAGFSGLETISNGSRAMHHFDVGTTHRAGEKTVLNRNVTHVATIADEHTRGLGRSADAAREKGVHHTGVAPDIADDT